MDDLRIFLIAYILFKKYYIENKIKQNRKINKL